MRSALAIVVGYLVTTVAILALYAAWFYDAPPGSTLRPSWTFILVALLWGFSSAALGAYIATVVARRRPFEHALALALVTGLIGVASMIASFGEEPVGFQIGSLLVLMAGCVAGGLLRASLVGRR